MRRNLHMEDRDILESINNARGNASCIQDVGRSDIEPELVLRLREIDSLGGIRYIVPFIFHSNHEVSEFALQRMHELFLHVTDNDLHWLDESIRAGYLYGYDLGVQRQWASVSVDKINSVVAAGGQLTSVLCVLSCRGNGYIREAALKRLIEVDMYQATRMLSIRANDWVRPIRDFATATLTKNIDVLDESLIVSFLGLVDQLRSRRRHDHALLISNIEKRFSSVNGQKALINAVGSADFRLARSAFQLSLKVVNDKPALVAVGAGSTDSLIRSWSLNVAQECLSGEILIEYLVGSSADTLASLRKGSIYALIALDYSFARGPLLHCLCSPSAIMRGFARFYLTRQEDFDFANYYRKQLLDVDNNLLAGVILGLSETGTESDWSAVLTYEHHDRPRVRAAVVSASVCLASDQRDWLLAKLLSGCPSEIKAAHLALVSGGEFTLSEIVDLHRDNFLGLQGRVLRKLVATIDYWFAAGLILQAIVSGGQTHKEEFYVELGAWLDRHGRKYCFVMPDTTVLSSIVNLSECIESTLGCSVKVSALREMVERLLAEGS